METDYYDRIADPAYAEEYRLKELIHELKRIANEAIEVIEDMAGGPCYPSIEYRKALDKLND